MLALIKFESHIEIAQILSNKLANILPEINTLDFDIIQTVPLHSSKVKSRGFNQVDVIFSHLLKADNPNLINRIKKTAPLFGLAREARGSELENAFNVSHPDQVSGKNILLLDDIFTTGATLSEIGRILKSAGAMNVYAITAAYTLMEE
jgi:competence protein ComFC